MEVMPKSARFSGRARDMACIGRAYPKYCAPIIHLTTRQILRTARESAVLRDDAIESLL